MPTPGEALLLWETLVFADADPCLRDCARSLREALDIWHSSDSTGTTPLLDPYIILCVCAFGLSADAATSASVVIVIVVIAVVEYLKTGACCR